MRRALEIDEKSYGRSHPKVAIDLNNLAQLLQATNRLEVAEPLMRRALEIDEKSGTGPEHPKSPSALERSGLSCFRPPTVLEAAEPSMRRALEIDEKSYRPGAPQRWPDQSSTTWPSCFQATNRLEAGRSP